jgi:peptide deformylase
MNLEIVLWPDPVLLSGTQPIEEVDEPLRQVVGEMRRVMFESRGVGLAAPQVGIAKRLMLVCPTGEPGEEEVVINPEILDHEDLDVGEEGCLSFPQIYGLVPRAKRIRVRYRDLEFQAREMVLVGFVARVFLHELDHLNGKVFIDQMLPESRKKIDKQLEELRRQFAAQTP